MISLYPWQKKGLRKWRLSGKRGTIQGATGTGKTHIGLRAIEKFNEDSTILIVVPFISLLEQWYEKIKENIGIKVGRLGGDHHDVNCKILIAVVNSIRDVEDLKRDLLILDECHRYSSKENFKFIGKGQFGMILGLSATPKNENEDRNKVIEYYAPIIYEYNIKEAVEDNIVSKYSVNFVGIKLNEMENKRYTEVQNYINVRRPATFNGFANLHPRLKKAYQERKDIANNAENKVKTTDEIIKINKNQKVIVFCEAIKMADAISNIIQEKHAVYHTGVSSKLRASYLEEFRNGTVRILITVKALDEGMDVPDTDIGIVVSSTKVERQSVQRLGRILRKQENKHALLYVLYSENTTEEYDAKKKEAIFKDSASDIKWISQNTIMSGGKDNVKA